MKQYDIPGTMKYDNVRLTFWLNDVGNCSRKNKFIISNKTWSFHLNIENLKSKLSFLKPFFIFLMQGKRGRVLLNHQRKGGNHDYTNAVFVNVSKEKYKGHLQ